MARIQPRDCRGHIEFVIGHVLKIGVLQDLSARFSYWNHALGMLEFAAVPRFGSGKNRAAFSPRLGTERAGFRHNTIRRWS